MTQREREGEREREREGGSEGERWERGEREERDRDREPPPDNEGHRGLGPQETKTRGSGDLDSHRWGPETLRLAAHKDNIPRAYPGNPGCVLVVNAQRQRLRVNRLSRTKQHLRTRSLLCLLGPSCIFLCAQRGPCGTEAARLQSRGSRVSNKSPRQLSRRESAGAVSSCALDVFSCVIIQCGSISPA